MSPPAPTLAEGGEKQPARTFAPKRRKRARHREPQKKRIGGHRESDGRREKRERTSSCQNPAARAGPDVPPGAGGAGEGSPGGCASGPKKGRRGAGPVRTVVGGGRPGLRTGEKKGVLYLS